MYKAITALALLASLGISAEARADHAHSEPRLRISRLSGKIEVETPGRKESVPGQRLPYIRSGSIVRVLSGAAEFRSDLHTTIRAGKGDAFQFTAMKPESGRLGAFNVQAVESDPKSLEVAVGGERFQLKRGERLSITATEPDEVAVQSEFGDVKITSGSARMLATRETLIVPVREEPRLEGSAIGLSGVNVVRKNETTFTAQGEGRPEPMRASVDDPRRAVASWPEPSRTAAEAMLEKYGEPASVDSDRITWNDNGGWKRTTVYRSPRLRGEVIEQTISYSVPPEKRSDLAKLEMLRINQADRELSALGESEETNFLALNLADEVVREKRSPEDARDFYQNTVRLSQAGKSSPYTQGLMFQP